MCDSIKGIVQGSYILHEVWYFLLIDSDKRQSIAIPALTTKIDGYKHQEKLK